MHGNPAGSSSPAAPSRPQTRPLPNNATQARKAAARGPGAARAHEAGAAASARESELAGQCPPAQAAQLTVVLVDGGRRQLAAQAQRRRPAAQPRRLPDEVAWSSDLAGPTSLRCPGHLPRPARTAIAPLRTAGPPGGAAFLSVCTALLHRTNTLSQSSLHWVTVVRKRPGSSRVGKMRHGIQQTTVAWLAARRAAPREPA